MKTHNGRLLLIAAIVLLQLMAVYALVLSLHRGLSGQFARNAEVTLEYVADGVVDRTRQFLAPVDSAVSVGKALIGDGAIDSENDARLESYFEAQLAATPWMSGMFLGRADGSFVFVARNEFGLRTKRIFFEGGERMVELVQRDQGGVITDRWMDAEDDYDPRKRSWYQQASDADHLVWTDPYVFFSSGLPGLSAAVVTGDGEVMGADVQIEQLSSFIERIPNADSGTALIVDNALNVVAHSGDVGISSSADSKPLALTDVASTPLQSLFSSGVESLSGNRLVITDIEDDLHFGLSRKFTVSDYTPEWTLLTQMRADDYDGGAVNYLSRLLLPLGVLSMSLGAVVLGAVLWLHRQGRTTVDIDKADPLTGLGSIDHFERLLEARARRCAQSNDRQFGVIASEVAGLQRLSDRSGPVCSNAVLVEMSRRLKGVAADDADMGISARGRFFVACEAADKQSLVQQFERIHEALAAPGTIDTPGGPQTIEVASGACIRESGENVGNLLPRAREALSQGIEQQRHELHLASGLDNTALQDFKRAA